MRVASLALFLSLSGLLFARDLAAQDLAPRDRCRIFGAITLSRVRITEVEGRAPRFVSLEASPGSVVPLRRGLVEVSSTLPDGRVFLGTSRVSPAFEIRAHVSLPGVELGAGVSVLDLEPVEGTAAADVDLVLAPGIILREQRVPCEALAVVEGTPRFSDLAFPADPGSPPVVPRARDLRVRPLSGIDPLRLRFADPSAVVLYERERRRGDVRVVLGLAGARVEGWVEDADVVAVPSLTARPPFHRRP